MRRNRRAPFVPWPSWRYGPNGESAIFKCEEDVPPGWYKKPGEVPEPFVPRPVLRLDRETLIARLKAQGIEINPLWGVAQMNKVLTE